MLCIAFDKTSMDLCHCRLGDVFCVCGIKTSCHAYKLLMLGYTEAIKKIHTIMVSKSGAVIVTEARDCCIVMSRDPILSLLRPCSNFTISSSMTGTGFPNSTTALERNLCG